MVDKLSANRKAAGLVTRLRAEVRVHEPLWLLEGETDGGRSVDNNAGPEKNSRNVAEMDSNLTEETPVEP